VFGAEDGKTKWLLAVAETGDLWLSQLHEQSLCSLEPVEGAEVGVVLPDDLSPVMGLANLRKSVYAVGGVMGVLMKSSCLMKSA
jgi:streptogramin lyase